MHCLSRLSQPGVQGLLLGRTVASQVVHLSASVSSTVGVGITAWAAPSSLEWQTWGHWSTLVSTTSYSTSLLAASFLCSKV